MKNDFSIREKYFGLIARIKKNKKTLFISFIAIAALFLVFKPVLIILALIITAVLSRIYEWLFKPHGLGIGIELMTFATVACTYLYSPFAGAFVGITSVTISVFVNQEDPKFLPISWLGLIAMAYISGSLFSHFETMAMSTVGLLSSVAYNVIVNPLFFLMLNSRISKILLFASTNIAFNYFVFAKLAGSVLAILS
jgi:hypothetical protein